MTQSPSRAGLEQPWWELSSSRASTIGRAAVQKEEAHTVKLNPDDSSAQHAAAMREHLESLDPELGALLAGHMDPETLAGLSETERKQLRVKIAVEARAFLDALPNTSKPST